MLRKFCLWHVKVSVEDPNLRSKVALDDRAKLDCQEPAMPPNQTVAAAIGSLRAVTYRVSSASDEQLPHVVSQIAGSIWTCRPILTIAPDSKQNSEGAMVLHRFKTQLSTFLQHRNFRVRWAGVVLLKAVIEAGGFEILSKSNGWVKNLLTILKKSDPPTTRILVTLTLTRVFMLTWDHPALIREITTPALSGFISTTLSNVENERCSALELEAALEAFITLVPRHPNAFRPNETPIRALLVRILSSPMDNDGMKSFSGSHRKAARKLNVLLHQCAPKQGSSEKWNDTLKATLKAAHATCDVIFRGTDEDWESVSGMLPSRPKHQLLSGDAEFEGRDTIGLQPWTGVLAGSERLIELLAIIATYFQSTTPAPVSTKIGPVLDLLQRLLTVQHGSTKFSKEVDREERESLLLALPRIHGAALSLLVTIHTRFQHSITSIHHTLVNHLAKLFLAERNDDGLRAGIYCLLATITDSTGAAFTKRVVHEISPVIRQSCVDLLPGESQSVSSTLSASRSPGIQNSSGRAEGTLANPRTTLASGLSQSARFLLLSAFTNLSASSVPVKVRSQMDRTAALRSDKALLLASVLNPAQREGEVRAQASLLPLLARTWPAEPEVDALLRPRMPIIFGKGGQTVGHEGQEDRAAEEDEEGSELSAESEVEADTADMDTKIDSVPNGQPTKAPVPLSQSEEQRTSQKRPAEASDLLDVAAQQSMNSLAKRSRFSQTPSTPQTGSIAVDEPAMSLLDDLEAQLQDDATSGRGRAVPTTINGIRQAESVAVTATSSKGGQAATESSAIPQDNDSDDEGSDFEMPPLTMDMDTDEEDDE